jgi:hypothetical protein
MNILNLSMSFWLWDKDEYLIYEIIKFSYIILIPLFRVYGSQPEYCFVASLPSFQDSLD